MRAVVAALAGIALWAGTAAAQEAPAPPSREVLAAYGSDLLSGANAQDLFTMEVEERAVRLRHTRSGMSCLFAPRSGSLTIVPSEVLGIPRGDDVSCSTQFGFATATLYATQRATPVTAQEEFDGAIEVMRATFRRVRRVELEPTSRLSPAPDGPMAESLTETFSVSDGRNQFFTRISVAVVNGWIIKLRFSGAEQRTNVLADMLWYATLRDLADHHDAIASPAEAAPPETPTPETAVPETAAPEPAGAPN